MLILCCRHTTLNCEFEYSVCDAWCVKCQAVWPPPGFGTDDMLF